MENQEVKAEENTNPAVNEQTEHKHYGRSSRRRGRKGLIIGAIIGALLFEAAVFVVAGTYYYRKHFQPNTIVNGANLSQMTAERAEAELAEAGSEEFYILKNADGTETALDLRNIGISRNYTGAVRQLIEAQPLFSWIPAYLGDEPNVLSLSDAAEVGYDEEALKNVVQTQLISADAVTQNAYIAGSTAERGYVIVRENGNQVLDGEAVAAVLAEHIRSGIHEVDLAAENCYKQPEISSEDENLRTVVTELNALDAFDAVINIGAGDGLLLKGEKLYDLIHTEDVSEFTDKLAELLDTYSEDSQRTYYTYDGRTVQIKTDYGWKMNREETVQSIKGMLEAVENALPNQAASRGEPTVVDSLPEGGYAVPTDGNRMTSDPASLDQAAKDPSGQNLIIQGAPAAQADTEKLSSGMELVIWDEKYGCRAHAVWEQEAASHRGNDIGDTFAEVDLENQTVRMIKTGYCVLETPCVTGLASSKDRATPEGIYAVKAKARNRVLTGRNRNGSISYRSPVSYWMPFNRGIGFHDATWRGQFGGTIYKTSGSHGCVNLPKVMAEKLFNLIDKGCPVILYHSEEKQA